MKIFNKYLLTLQLLVYMRLSIMPLKVKIYVLYSNCKCSLIKWVNRKQKQKINDKSLLILDDNIIHMLLVAAFILESYQAKRNLVTVIFTQYRTIRIQCPVVLWKNHLGKPNPKNNKQTNQLKYGNM